MAMDKNELRQRLDKLHTTPLGVERIRRNLGMSTCDVVSWCKEHIAAPDSQIKRRGKNWYIVAADCEITVNAYSYTIITVHRLTKEGIL